MYVCMYCPHGVHVHVHVHVCVKYFSLPSCQVRESEKMFAESKTRSQYIQSLQHIVCISYRNLSEDEVTLEEKVSTQCHTTIECVQKWLISR